MLAFPLVLAPCGKGEAIFVKIFARQEIMTDFRKTFLENIF
jgi:hypothetical protein